MCADGSILAPGALADGCGHIITSLGERESSSRPVPRGSVSPWGEIHRPHTRSKEPWPCHTATSSPLNHPGPHPYFNSTHTHTHTDTHTYSFHQFTQDRTGQLNTELQLDSLPLSPHTSLLDVPLEMWQTPIVFLYFRWNGRRVDNSIYFAFSLSLKHVCEHTHKHAHTFTISLSLAL